MADPVVQSDVNSLMLARLAENLKKPKVCQLLGIHATRYQALENLIFSMLSLYSTISTGIWLDRIGKIVGEDRGGALDPDYQTRIRARIKASASDGTCEDILEVVRLLVGPVRMLTATVKAIEFYPASFVIDVGGAILALTEPPIFKRFIKDSRGLGIGYGLLYQTVPNNAVFTFAGGGGLGFGDVANPATGGKFRGVI